MKLIVDIPDTEYQMFILACNHGMGNTAMERILNGTPLKEGHWNKVFNDIEGEVRFYCSECNDHQMFTSIYCPNCGVKMESKDGE